MIQISLRQAQLLSYLTGRARVGEAFNAPLTQIAGDLEMSESQVCQFMRHLVRRGLVERVEGGLLRVVRRLEDQNVEIWRIPSQELKGKARVPYAGFDARAAALWWR